MQNDAFEPAFVVDVGTTWTVKMTALDAYASQLARADGEAAGAAAGAAPTKVASRAFRLAVEGRARHFGNLIGAEWGEPFWSGGALAVADPWQLLPRGLR
jgi:LmbE family N-acetylglucosaminyl deacetylase